MATIPANVAAHASALPASDRPIGLHRSQATARTAAPSAKRPTPGTGLPTKTAASAGSSGQGPATKTAALAVSSGPAPATKTTADETPTDQPLSLTPEPMLPVRPPPSSTAARPESELWRPWDWEAFPPRALVWNRPPPPYDSVGSTRAPAKRRRTADEPPNWHFVYMRAMGRQPADLTMSAQRAQCYNVVLALVLDPHAGRAPASTVAAGAGDGPSGGGGSGDDSWCDLLRLQRSRVLLACCLVISQHTPRGRFLFFAPDVDRSSKQPAQDHGVVRELMGSTVSVAGSDGRGSPKTLGDLRALMPLLECANSIVTWDARREYGALRANPDDVDDLRSLDFAPYRDLANRAGTDDDPLRPRNDHPYSDRTDLRAACMDPHAAFERPAVDKVVHPSVRVAPDPGWRRLEGWTPPASADHLLAPPDAPQRPPPGLAADPADDLRVRNGGASAEHELLASEPLEPRPTAPDGFTPLCQSVRFRRPTGGAPKTLRAGYMHTTTLALLLTKTLSPALDLKLPRRSLLVDTVRRNAPRAWWRRCNCARTDAPDWISLPARRFEQASEHQVAAWMRAGRTSDACAALAWEACVLADLAFAIYHEHARVLTVKEAEKCWQDKVVNHSYAGVHSVTAWSADPPPAPGLAPTLTPAPAVGKTAPPAARGPTCAHAPALAARASAVRPHAPAPMPGPTPASRPVGPPSARAKTAPAPPASARAPRPAPT